ATSCQSAQSRSSKTATAPPPSTDESRGMLVALTLKQRCCPNAVARKVPRDLNEDARDVARAIAGTPDYERSRHRRKKVEMLFAHLKRILRMARLRLRGPCGARDEFLLAATAQNLRRLAKLRPSRLPAAMTA
ncbi:transposase, partial [Sinorhizobium medicae]|uniref:transposase n=1 Tax=Sinorhizobium medicae TaxID=110321 RepID=UPI001F3B0FE4